MAEDEMNEADLSGRLATVLEEIRDVMEKRKQRIEELRQKLPRSKMIMTIWKRPFLNCWIVLVNQRR